MQERHQKRDQYFDEQSYTTEHFVMPLINKFKLIDKNTHVLEIGCGEGGNLKPFLDVGCKVTGIDLLEGKIKNARKFFDGHPNENRLELICDDIYNMVEDFNAKFDIVFMRDVLEHIHDQERFLRVAKLFLKPKGKFFLGFPPWQNPFGGHQQMCESKILSKLPWFHLLPGRLYPGLMRVFHEKPNRISALMEIKDTRIHIERFKKIIKKENYVIDAEEFWFINPNYKIKFGMKPRKQTKFLSSIPFLRNFIITTCYYIISNK